MDGYCKYVRLQYFVYNLKVFIQENNMLNFFISKTIMNIYS